MMRRMVATLVFLICAAPALGERQTGTTRPCVGVTFTWAVQADPPLRLYTVSVDLTNRAIHLRVCAGDAGKPAPGWDTTLNPVSQIARREHLEVAVNGSFFDPRAALLIAGRRVPYFRGNSANACGWTVSDGRLWSQQNRFAGWPSLVVLRDGSVHIGTFVRPPDDAMQMVSGYRLLVHEGRNVAGDGPPAPRTGVGLDGQGHTLILMVVDGRRPEYSVGLTPEELGDELIAAGATEAIDLDNGGSSTMVMREGEEWKVINRPSDGHDLPLGLSVERAVVNALGVVVDQPSTRP